MLLDKVAFELRAALLDQPCFVDCNDAYFVEGDVVTCAIDTVKRLLRVAKNGDWKCEFLYSDKVDMAAAITPAISLLKGIKVELNLGQANWSDGFDQLALTDYLPAFESNSGQEWLSNKCSKDVSSSTRAQEFNPQVLRYPSIQRPTAITIWKPTGSEGWNTAEGWVWEISLDQDRFTDDEEVPLTYKLLECPADQASRHAQYIGLPAHIFLSGKWNGKIFRATAERADKPHLTLAKGNYRFVFSDDGSCKMQLQDSPEILLWAVQSPSLRKAAADKTKLKRSNSSSTVLNCVGSTQSIQAAQGEAAETIVPQAAADSSAVEEPSPSEQAAEIPSELVQQLVEIALNVLNLEIAPPHAEAVLRVHQCDMQAAMGHLQNSTPDGLEKLL